VNPLVVGSSPTGPTTLNVGSTKSFNKRSLSCKVYIGRLNRRPYHDLRGQSGKYSKLFDPNPANYEPPQQLAAELRTKGSWGLLYNRVRKEGGECVAAFRLPALGVVHQGAHLAYHWDGRKIVDVLELRSLEW
jgi:hypothetical protein